MNSIKNWGTNKGSIKPNITKNNTRFASENVSSHLVCVCLSQQRLSLPLLLTGTQSTHLSNTSTPLISLLLLFLLLLLLMLTNTPDLQQTSRSHGNTSLSLWNRRIFLPVCFPGRDPCTLVGALSSGGNTGRTRSVGRHRMSGGGQNKHHVFRYGFAFPLGRNLAPQTTL